MEWRAVVLAFIRVCVVCLLGQGLVGHDVEKYKASRPPCCMDTISRPACRRLLSTSRRHFQTRCNGDAEFRLIQCCGSCNQHKGSVPYEKIVNSLLATQNCSDRYGEHFCRRYVNPLDEWTLRKWNCAGHNPYMAFRACRRTCGFCDLRRIDYSIGAALDSCRNVSDN